MGFCFLILNDADQISNWDPSITQSWVAVPFDVRNCVTLCFWPLVPECGLSLPFPLFCRKSWTCLIWPTAWQIPPDWVAKFASQKRSMESKSAFRKEFTTSDSKTREKARKKPQNIHIVAVYFLPTMQCLSEKLSNKPIIQYFTTSSSFR